MFVFGLVSGGLVTGPILGKLPSVVFLWLAHLRYAPVLFGVVHQLYDWYMGRHQATPGEHAHTTG